VVEVDFHVARALEIFKNHIVHARAGVDQSRRHDGDRAALFDVAGGTEETLGFLERVGVETTREHLARRRRDPLLALREASTAPR
jgi:hypothetical protein